MPIKTLKYWEAQFLAACGFACLYNCPLSLDQFCASRGLEPYERDLLLDYFHTHHICR